MNDFIDTGSYIFNALLGGSIHRGLPSNKITAIAGESATGKTFFVLGMCKNFLDKNPDAGVIFFESESAITKELMSLTEKDSIFMHCLPAHRGEEVSADVIDGAKSVVWRQAFHRRTTIQALLYHLTRGDLKGNK